MSDSRNDKMVTLTDKIHVGRDFMKSPDRRFVSLRGIDYVNSPSGSYNLATRQKEATPCSLEGDYYPLPQNIFHVQYTKVSYLGSLTVPSGFILPEHKDPIPLPVERDTDLHLKYYFTQFPANTNWFAACTPRAIWIGNGPKWSMLTRTSDNKYIHAIAPYGNNAIAVLTQTYAPSATHLTVERFDIDFKAMTCSLRDACSRLVPEGMFPDTRKIWRSDRCYSTPMMVSPTHPNTWLLNYSQQLDMRAFVVRKISNNLQVEPIDGLTKWLPDGSLAHIRAGNPVQITIDADERKLVMHRARVNLMATEISSNGNIYALGQDDHLDIFRMNSVSVYLENIISMVQTILEAPRGVIKIITDYEMRCGDTAVCLPDLIESKELEIRAHKQITEEFRQKIIHLHKELRANISHARNHPYVAGLKVNENRKQQLENFVAKLNGGLALEDCINALEQNEALFSALGLAKQIDKPAEKLKLVAGNNLL